MKITDVEMLHCDAGWRPWSFLKITTDAGITGWSECTDSPGNPLGVEGVVKDLTPLLMGQDPRRGEKVHSLLFARTRQNPGGVVYKAIGGIENALLDIKAKALDMPVYELFGGPVREDIPVYWSHCGTSRVRAWEVIGKPQIRSLEDVGRLGEEIRASGFRAIKTNIAMLEGEEPYVYMPGFARGGGSPALNPDREVLESAARYIGTLREAVGDEIDIMLDLNYNFKTEGYIRIARTLEPFNLAWFEIDSYDPGALRRIRDSIAMPVCSCENMYGARQYRPYFETCALDIASVDVIWNGLNQARKIADLADIYEVNVTPHNYNGYLSTFISAHFGAIIPNLRIMELDVDDVPWREELFTHRPHIENGRLRLPDGPGWGTEINEDIARAHPWPK